MEVSKFVERDAVVFAESRMAQRLSRHEADESAMICAFPCRQSLRLEQGHHEEMSAFIPFALGGFAVRTSRANPMLATRYDLWALTTTQRKRVNLEF
jgi:hypothetical protein